MPKCPPTGGVRLQEVSVSGGSTVVLKILMTKGNMFMKIEGTLRDQLYLLERPELSHQSLPGFNV